MVITVVICLDPPWRKTHERLDWPMMVHLCRDFFTLFFAPPGTAMIIFYNLLISSHPKSKVIPISCKGWYALRFRAHCRSNVFREAQLPLMREEKFWRLLLTSFKRLNRMPRFNCLPVCMSLCGFGMISPVLLCARYDCVLHNMLYYHIGHQFSKYIK